MTRSQKIKKMLDMQDRLNTKVRGVEWHEQGLAWSRAMWVEAAELMDAIGYKWWKHQIMDVEKVHAEIVDILHFLLSWSMENAPLTSPLQDSIDGLMSWPDATHNDPRAAVERFVETIFMRHKHSRFAPLWQSFSALMVACDLSFDDMFSKYILKNVLNEFRSTNGYATGAGVLSYYNKVWHDGREDNEHLAEIGRIVDFDSPTIEADIWIQLENRYYLGDA